MNNRNPKEHSNVKIGLNSEKSLGEFRGLAITQILGKDHQLMLVEEIRKSYNNNNNNSKRLIMIN